MMVSFLRAGLVAICPPSLVPVLSRPLGFVNSLLRSSRWRAATCLTAYAFLFLGRAAPSPEFVPGVVSAGNRRTRGRRVCRCTTMTRPPLIESIRRGSAEGDAPDLRSAGGGVLV